MKPTAKPRVAIYARVSKANGNGETTSVDEQVKVLDELVARHGGTLVATLTDRAVSASGAGKSRPGWAEVLRLVAAQEVDAVALWEVSRSSRRLAEWATFRDLCRDHGVAWLTPDAGLVEPYGGRDRMSLGVKAVVAEEEAEQTSQRIRRALRDRAAQGGAHGDEAYGYARVYSPATGRLESVEVEPVEAAIIARMADEALTGKPLRAIARDLNAQGVTSPRDSVRIRRGREPIGAKWESRTVKAMLVNRVYLGLRVHVEKDRFTGRVVGESEHRACWPAILTTEQHAALVALLCDPARNSRPDNGTEVRHWATGVLRCGLCDERMRFSGGTARDLYQCTGCKRVVVAVQVEEMVADVVIARLERPDAAQAFDSGDPGADAAREVLKDSTQRLEDLGLAFAEGRLSLQAFTAADARLRQRAQEAKKTLERTSVSLPGFATDLQDVRASWESWAPSARRMVASALLEKVTVAPVGKIGRPKKGAPKVSPERLAFVWR